MKYTLMIPWRDASMTDVDPDRASVNGENIISVFQERDALKAENAKLELTLKGAVQRGGELLGENAKLREELDRYLHMVSPENAIDLGEFMGPPKPCPFCGSVALTHDGFEEYIVCGNCGASAPVGGWQFRHETARIAETLEEHVVQAPQHVVQGQEHIVQGEE